MQSSADVSEQLLRAAAELLRLPDVQLTEWDSNAGHPKLLRAAGKQTL